MHDFDYHSGIMATQITWRAKKQDTNTVLFPNSLTTTKSEKQGFVIQPYHPDNNPIQDLIYNNWYGLKTYVDGNFFINHHVFVVFASC